MKEEIQIYQLQYLINKTGINGEYEIADVKDSNYERGSSSQTIWSIMDKGDKVEFKSKLECNDENSPRTKRVLKFEYITEYQIHHKSIEENPNDLSKQIWNLAELLFRHRCLIQQLFIQNKNFKKYGFPQTTESLYYNYQEIKQRIKL